MLSDYTISQCLQQNFWLESFIIKKMGSLPAFSSMGEGDYLKLLSISNVTNLQHTCLPQREIGSRKELFNRELLLS